MKIFDSVNIDTEHVKIRPLSSVAWQKVADGLLYEGSYYARNWGIKTVEDIKQMCEKAQSGLSEEKGNPLVFLNKDETEVLGMTNFMNVEPANRMLEIGGTWINPKFQRSFVNTETKYALLQYCFEKLQLNRVEFRIDCDNKPSQKAVQRLGFHFDGLLPRRIVNGGAEVRDYLFYSVIDLTWPAVKKHINELIEKSKLKEFSVVQRINSLDNAGDSGAAFSAVTKALEEFPNSPILNYQAACLCDSYRTETEAVPFYVKALKLGLSGDDRQGAFLGLGSTYRSLGEYEKSKTTFESGIKEFPNYRPYYIFLALTEYNLGDGAEAIRLLLEQILGTTSDQEILSYKKALQFYSTRLSEVFE